MAAASVASNAPRAGGLLLAAVIPLTITASTTTYTTASGGLPFDIAALLNQVGPFSSGVQPSDVYFAVGGSAAGWRADGFAVGTATYTTNSDASSARSQETSVATCPCTIRLWNGTTEFSNGNCSEVITGLLIVSRGGRL